MKTRYIVTVLFVLALPGVAFWLWPAPAGPTHSPDITVTNLRGEQLRFAQLRGQPLLVTFWATSCAACLKEMPHLIELYKELAPRGFRMIGIAMPYDPPNRVIALNQAKKIPYDIALDVQGKAAKAFGDVRLTPSSFLIAPDGRIVLQRIGDLNVGQVRALVIDMLARSDQPRLRLAGY